MFCRICLDKSLRQQASRLVLLSLDMPISLRQLLLEANPPLPHSKFTETLPEPQTIRAILNSTTVTLHFPKPTCVILQMSRHRTQEATQPPSLRKPPNQPLPPPLDVQTRTKQKRHTILIPSFLPIAAADVAHEVVPASKSGKSAPDGVDVRVEVVDDVL